MDAALNRHPQLICLQMDSDIRRLTSFAREMRASLPDAAVVARGVVAYDAAELATMIGRSTSELPAELRRPAVHADDLVAV